MGFDTERFIDAKLAEEFKCGIWLEVFEEPVMISACDHIYCRECITEWLKTDTICPVDRTPIEDSDLVQPTRLIRNLHGKLEIKCDFEKVGIRNLISLQFNYID